jgi:hypothetical protein
MFEQLKAAAGMASLLKDLPRIQARLMQVKDELGRIQCVGHSSCRRVRAVMNGRLELVSVDIDPEAMADASPQARASLQTATVEAVNDATRHARREAGTRMADVARELGIPIPPQLLQHL